MKSPNNTAVKPDEFLREIQKGSLEAIQLGSLSSGEPTPIQTQAPQEPAPQDSSAEIRALAIFTLQAQRIVFDLTCELRDAQYDNQALRAEIAQLRQTIESQNELIAAKNIGSPR